MKTTQITGSPLAIVSDKGKLEEEKEETRYEDQATIQTLVELPKIGTPTQTLQKPSTNMISLQVQTPSLTSTKVAMILHYGDLELDEEIVIPSYESNTLTIEKINEIQGALDRRKRQEVLRKEFKHNQALNDIKDIFVDAFSLHSPNESKPIMEKLSNIVDQVTNEDHDTNVKLMKWLERKFQGKLNEKISSDIA